MSNPERWLSKLELLFQHPPIELDNVYSLLFSLDTILWNEALSRTLINAYASLLSIFIGKGEEEFLDLFTNHVTINIYVLGPLMKSRVSNKVL